MGAGIKRPKHHLISKVGNDVLSFEELTSLIGQVEDTLDLRPLGVISDGLKGGEVLTPAHLFCGRKLETFPTVETPKKSDVSNCTATIRWAHIQFVLLHFWKRWKKEYVRCLQARKKWKKEVSNLKIGDVVFIPDDNVATLKWLM